MLQHTNCLCDPRCDCHCVSASCPLHPPPPPRALRACAVRSAKFIARKQWMVCGADDMQLRVYNYNTMDKVKTFEAHADYIRCAADCVRRPATVGAAGAMPLCFRSSEMRHTSRQSWYYERAR
jgi:hypothetical protein